MTSDGKYAAHRSEVRLTHRAAGSRSAAGIVMAWQHATYSRKRGNLEGWRIAISQAEKRTRQTATRHRSAVRARPISSPGEQEPRRRAGREINTGKTELEARLSVCGSHRITAIPDDVTRKLVGCTHIEETRSI